MTLFGSPGRTLAASILLLLVVVVVATEAYHLAGWSLGDAFYMVILTIYSVGYEEVHPIDTPYLHAVTLGTMIFGCTGAILFTGALVQSLTATQLQHFFGTKRMTRDIDKLKQHVIVVGIGRTGMMLARELHAGGADFVLIDTDPGKVDLARKRGYLSLVGDGTEEEVLASAGIARARALATVLPEDASNVFITLSARSLNRDVTIVSRGEMPATEGKLRQAGADQVVLTAQIGAERVAEVLLYPETMRAQPDPDSMETLEQTLRRVGLQSEVVVCAENGAMTGLSLAEIESRAGGRFVIVQLLRKGGEVLLRPDLDLCVEPGDGVVIVGRDVSLLRAMFDPPPAESVTAPGA